MTTVSLITTLASLALFGGFVGLSVHRFGWRRSYSAYAAKWHEAVPLASNTHLWSIVTVVVALLLVPALLERGEGDPWQFLGFFAPMYLCFAAFTPEYETDKRQMKIHIIGTSLCAIVSVAWICFVAERWWTIPVWLVAAWLAAYATITVKKSWLFWLEMAMFGAAYTTIFIG
ncbi:MAG: hypothetical protein J5382_10250 [Bacteroidales bacterium]|nr:hypothetical protein [Bacteroidales bacterium]